MDQGLAAQGFSRIPHPSQYDGLGIDGPNRSESRARTSVFLRAHRPPRSADEPPPEEGEDLIARLSCWLARLIDQVLGHDAVREGYM
jgi:hypothetical protein